MRSLGVFLPPLPSRTTLSLILSPFVFLGAFAVAYADEYVGSNARMAAYIAWTADGSGLAQEAGPWALSHLRIPGSGSTRHGSKCTRAGQIQMTEIAADPAKLTHSNAAFTGTRSASALSIAFGALATFGGQTWTGKIGWNTLTLRYPAANGSMGQLSMRPGSPEDYERATAILQKSVTSAQATQSLLNAARATAARVKDEESVLSSALDRLNSEFSNPPPSADNPKGFLSRYERLWQNMQATWAKERP